MNNKYSSLVLLLSALNNVLLVSGETSSGREYTTGCAVYRDGAVAGLNWHAGIVVGKNENDVPWLSHAPGPGKVVCGAEEDEFVQGKNFIGFYTSQVEPSSEQFNRIAETARSLTRYGIKYCFSMQMKSEDIPINQKIQPSQVVEMRCDGVVEYSYEYCGLRIYGAANAWDISIANPLNSAEHTLAYITPYKQASNYMKRVVTDSDYVCDGRINKKMYILK